MSGFVGVVNRDGAPVDRDLLNRMTRALAFRGPDAQQVWRNGSVGLGHALLQITPATELQIQPIELDGRFWIVADARIDARSELLDKLKTKSRAADGLSFSSPDALLILHAYDAWGESCVEHLLGDFSFAIWDARERQLFCGRDHFGVKPFFYSSTGRFLIFSNTLNCVRMHPAVSNRLNELAIADFLLFDKNQDSKTTAFADVHRLPPAHYLDCRPGEVSVQRYWRCSVSAPVHFRRESEYIERFRELMDAAVADRIRGKNAAVLMSGGLDSTTVAASAKRVIKQSGNGGRLSAYTDVMSNLIPDNEQTYATVAAQSLGIPIEFSVGPSLKVFDRAELPDYQNAEPAHIACLDRTSDHLKEISRTARTALTGYGGDPALCGRISVHFRQLLNLRQFGIAASDAFRYLRSEGRFSRLYLGKRWRILFGSSKNYPHYPNWLSEDFERRLNLRERWEIVNRSKLPVEAVRPEAQEGMADPIWPQLFEGYDSGETRVPVDVYHPFFDLRLVKFLLALPRLPWCTDKELLREAARGVLPEEVRLRRKSPLRADPLVSLLQRPDSAWVDSFDVVPVLGRFVARNRIPKVYRGTDTWKVWINLRPLCLNFWLRRMG